MFLISLTSVLSFRSLLTSYMVKEFTTLFESAVRKVEFGEKDSNILEHTWGKNILADLKASGACSIQFIDRNSIRHQLGSRIFPAEPVSKIMMDVNIGKKQRTEIIASGFNIPFFFDKRRFLIVAGPLFDYYGTHIATIGIIWDLGQFYSHQRRIECLLIMYIIINTLILAAVGVYQIGNITAKPLNKILKKMDAITIGDIGLNFETESDFDKLSSLINLIVDDLASSKKNLQYTVTELESANTNMKKMQKEIIRAEKMASIGRLSAGLAHEIGNPVGIISGYLEMLKQEEIEDSNRIDFASRADDELTRIDLIIRELLDYARPTDQVKTELSVHQLIKDLVSVYTGSRAIGNIDLKTDFKAYFDNVNANHDQLRQVFMNLIINASDAICDSENRNAGLLMISTANIIKDEGSCNEMIVSFIDNGCGLSGDDLDNIFDPFFTTKPQGKGTGLGLSVSQMIVEDIGGSIKAYSLDGHGTEFRIILPLVKEGS